MVKKVYTTLLFIFLSNTSYAKITVTSHNLSGLSKESDTCLYCHIPNKRGNIQTPLWDSSASKTKFTIYKHSKIEGGSDTYSMLCLSCHDGISSKNSIVSLGDQDYFNSDEIKITSRSRGLTLNSYGDLDDHPVSIEYPVNKSGFKDINEPLVGQWKNAITVSDILKNGKVECESCHDPHFTSEDGKFLRNQNYRSQLCLSCHDL